MQRRTFLGTAGLTAAATAAGTAPAGAAPGGPPADGGPADGGPADGGSVDTAFEDRLLRAAEDQVATVLVAYPDQLTELWANRAVARSALRLVSVMTAPTSRFHRSPDLLGPLADLVAGVRATQHRDGTWDQGNLHTPPDSAFVVNDLCGVLTLLEADDDEATTDVRAELRTVLRSASQALVTGGVHTPNHRWEVSAALARLHELVPDGTRQLDRVEQWLAEGVDIDGDGQYSERSANYAFVVTNPCLLALARYTGHVELRGAVRRNLDLQLRLLEDDGTVESVQSRRQDQKEVRDSSDGLLQFRELALRDGDGRYARFVLDQLARTDAAARAGDGDAWAEVRLHPDLLAPLPAPASLSGDGVDVLADSSLVRLRRGRAAASVFGGADFVDDPDRPGPIGSGLSTNPTFLKYRRGAAVLSSVRLAPRFFSLGHFRSQGVAVGDDGTVTLHQRVTAGYHQPLAPADRRGDGDYELGSEGRFFAAMSFDRRARDERVLETTVVVRPVDGDLEQGLDLEFTLTGTEEPGDVPVVVELAFSQALGAQPGVLAGAEVLEEGEDGAASTHQLAQGWGTWTVGEDRLRFGPGTGAGPRQPTVVDPGERYTWLGGDLVPAGTRVLLTTTVPGSWTLSLR